MAKKVILAHLGGQRAVLTPSARASTSVQAGDAPGTRQVHPPLGLSGVAQGGQLEQGTPTLGLGLGAVGHSLVILLTWLLCSLDLAG